MVLATGSQGERRAASAQLAQGKYLGFELRAGDTFLFSSKTIPGNEVSVARILNALSEKGVTVIDDSDGHYHVSGHANRPDLVTLAGAGAAADAGSDARRAPPPFGDGRARRATAASPRRSPPTARWWT